MEALGAVFSIVCGLACLGFVWWLWHQLTTRGGIIGGLSGGGFEGMMMAIFAIIAFFLILIVPINLLL